MDIPPDVQAEWNLRHSLSRETLARLHRLADPGDTHPTITAIETLRAHDS